MRLFAHQLRSEQLVFWRSREAAIFIFIFPVMLFLLLGAVYSGTHEGRPVTDYLVTGLLTYGAANTAFAGLAISLVIRRESGLLKRIRSTPLPPSVYLGAALASILAVFTLQSAVLVGLGRALYGAALPVQPLALVAALAAGALAFAAMGIGISGVIRSSEGASAVVNVLVLPMAFLSGAFGPTRNLPEALQAVADLLPLRHLVEVVEAVYLTGEGLGGEAASLAVLAAWGAAGLALAVRRFRWEPRER
ncbi:MAG TPA: ABC transporter permease [Gaiellaceae bacterium]|nr:ABC transporter permease [Gaiellaceae bacterium]